MAVVANRIRPAARFARTVRRTAWLVATVAVLVFSAGFAWVLGRAASGTPPVPLAPQEAALVQQTNGLTQRVAHDQSQLNALTQKVAALTGQGQGQGQSAPPASAMPQTMTGASGG